MTLLTIWRRRIAAAVVAMTSTTASGPVLIEPMFASPVALEPLFASPVTVERMQ